VFAPPVSFQRRLHVVGLDLRDAPAIEHFAHFLHVTFGRHAHRQSGDEGSSDEGSGERSSSSRSSSSSSSSSGGGDGGDAASGSCCGSVGLFAVVHNACQTVRRPPAYYRHLLGAELAPPAAAAAPAQCLAADAACWAAFRGAGGESGSSGSSGSSRSSGAAIEAAGDGHGDGSLEARGGGGSGAAVVAVGSAAGNSSQGAPPQPPQPLLLQGQHVPSALRAAVPLVADDWAYGAGGGADDWAKAAATDAAEGCLVVAPSEAVAKAAALREAHFPSGALDHNGSQVTQHDNNA
jgi:hypothetical protein